MKQHILKSILILLVGVLLFSTVSCDKLGKNYTCSWCGMRLQDTYYAYTEMNLQVVDSKSMFFRRESTKMISKPVIKIRKSTIRPSSSLYHKRCAIENEEEKNKKNFIYDEWHEYQIKGFVSQ